MISVKKPLDKLSSKERIMVYELMIEGIHFGLAQHVKAKTHSYFASCLQREKDFSPTELWDSLALNTQSHFDHARKAIEKLESLIDLDDSPVKPLKPARKVEPAPAPVVTKKKSLKKKKR